VGRAHYVAKGARESTFGRAITFKTGEVQSLRVYLKRSDRDPDDKPGTASLGRKADSWKARCLEILHDGFGGGCEETYWLLSNAPCTYPTGENGKRRAIGIIPRGQGIVSFSGS
jgi:hypothetical protein